MERLSSLLERGWATLPQIRGNFRRKDYQTEEITGACAVGAICYALDPDYIVNDMDDAKALIPAFEQLVHFVPLGSTIEVTENLGGYLVELNDIERRPKEEIIEALKSRGL